jgi:hypothetical protein
MPSQTQLALMHAPSLQVNCVESQVAAVQLASSLPSGQSL